MKDDALSQEEVRFYRDQGYFKLTGCLDKEQTKELRDFIFDEAAKPKAIDRTNPNKKIYGLYDRNPTLVGKAIGNKALTGVLTSLLGPNVVLVKNRHNHATINSHQGAPAEGMHRDILQPSRGLLTAAIYLQDSTISNGATRIILGSQNLPYVGVPQVDGGGTWMADHKEYMGLESQAVPVPMNEGDVLLFNGALFHGVGYNSSGDTRISMTFGFRSSDELDAIPDSARQLLVAGEHIYRGNDR